MATEKNSPFLTAEWRDLVVLNYSVNPKLLQPLVPAGVELETWDRRTLISLVAFRFLKTRVWGLPVPWHTNFVEINLRGHVRRKVFGEWRRGVFFIHELVPRAAIAWLARALYNENYHVAAMDSQCAERNAEREMTYAWEYNRKAHRLTVKTDAPPVAMAAGSEAEFIYEHYWGYSKQRDGGTLEYEVTHEPWKIWEMPRVKLEYHGGVYGSEFDVVLAKEPASAFVAEGSAVKVFGGKRLSL